jgi:predicted ATPase
MIRRVAFENFMSLRNVTVDLSPLTIFIGENGAGKSAIFKGLVLLSRLLSGAALRGAKGQFYLEHGVTLDDLVWSGNTGLPVRFRVWFDDDDDDDPGYTLELSKGPQGWSVTRERSRTKSGSAEVDTGRSFQYPTESGEQAYKVPLQATLRYLVYRHTNDSKAVPAITPILELARKYGQVWRYRPSASDIASHVQRPSAQGTRPIHVAENGWGVAAELQGLQGSQRDLFQSVEDGLCRLFPHVKAIGFKTDWQGVRLYYRTDRSQDLVPAPQESDGVLLATFLLWRLYSAKQPITVCLEEPENGLHPFLLGGRFRILKRFAYGLAGLPQMQLLVATHSPEFLRALKAHPTALWKEIRIVSFAPGVGSSVRTLSNYREAANLFEEYLDKIQKQWEPIVKEWNSEH